MTKAEDLMMKWEHVTPSESEAILNAINDAMEWAAQQCEEMDRTTTALAHDRHVVDAAAIRAGKSQ